jgi:ATP-binding cassette, subfamily F, member 3
MLTVSNLSKRYGDDLVLDRVGFTINAGERVGLIGPNGAGKSTLLRIMAGAEHADSGSVTRAPPSLMYGYLPQGWEGAPDATVTEVLRDAHCSAAVLDELVALEVRLAAPGLAGDDLDTLLGEYATTQERFEALGGYEWAHRTQAVRAGLGLADLSPDMPVALLSGGQKTRLGLARLLLASPRLLLLDEPTNHLDVDAVAWLEDFVRGYDGAALVVSHDRAFLDRTVTRILELKQLNRGQNEPQIQSYPGNYSDYIVARAAARARQQAQWQDQQAYIERVAADIRRVKQHGQVNPHSPAAKKAGRKAKAREHKLERYLESEERVDKPGHAWGLKLDFGPPADSARMVLRVENVRFSYPTNESNESRIGYQPLVAADNRPPTTDDERGLLLRDVSFEVQYGERVALIGPNGAGKSTLLRLITGQLQPEVGRVRLGASVQVGYLAQEQQTLDGHRTVLDSLGAVVPWSVTECRSFLHRYLFAADDVFRPIGACSFGERARLALALLIARGCTFLVLDEPINHLDISARERFETALATFDGAVLAVAHDRYFLAQFAERVLALCDGRLVDYPGGYANFARDVEGASAFDRPYRRWDCSCG